MARKGVKMAYKGREEGAILQGDDRGAERTMRGQKPLSTEYGDKKELPLSKKLGEEGNRHGQKCKENVVKKPAISSAKQQKNSKCFHFKMTLLTAWY